MFSNSKLTFIWGEGGNLHQESAAGAGAKAPHAALPVHTRVNNTRESGGGPCISGTFGYVPDVINGKVVNCWAV